MLSRIRALTILSAAFFAIVPAGYGQDKAADKEPLKFAPLQEMARSGQTASFDWEAPLKVVLVEPGRGIIGQPMNLEVVVENTGTKASGKETGLIVEFEYARRTEAYGLMVGELAPQAKRIHSFQYVPRGKLTHVSVHPGSWEKSASSTGVYSYEIDRAPGAAARPSGNVKADYDPSTPLAEFLPKVPSRAKPQAGLPATLADVPEVSFAEHLSHAIPSASAELHFVTTIEKIHHVNQKKTDAYMDLMREHRPDLAGLPFLLGDACRLKGETSKRFAVETAKIRKVQRDLMTINNLVQQSDLMPEALREAAEAMNHDGRIISALAKDSSGSKDWGPEGHGLFPVSTRVAAMMQMLTQESAGNRLEMITYLDNLADADATRALAKLAIYSEERQLRSAAVRALKTRRDRDYSDILVNGLSYPWPAVAQRSSEAIVQLGRTDLVPQLIDVLGQDDPRGPSALNGKNTKVVKEVVRINHLHNCLLCHAPAPASGEGDKSAVEPDLTAQVPVPSSPIVQYYGGSVVPDMLVRFDVTYLRQDFTMNLPVKDAKPWPEMQRFDFVVRTRAVADQEARTIGELLQQSREGGLSPYQLAALTALRELTGRDAEPTPAAWKRVLSR